MNPKIKAAIEKIECKNCDGFGVRTLWGSSYEAAFIDIKCSKCEGTGMVNQIVKDNNI